MKKISIPIADSVALRRKAEARLKDKSAEAPLKLSESEMRKLIQELLVHQLELEIQNEELIQVMLSEEHEVKLTHKLEVQQLELESQKDELEHAICEAQDAIDLYDFAPIGYFTLSRTSEILRLNVSGAKLLGDDRSYFRNLRLGTFVSDESKPIFNLFIESLFAGNKNESCEISILTKNGLTVFVQLSGIVREQSDECLLTGTDITGRKKAEMALLQSEVRYRTLFEMSPSGIVLYDQDGIIREANNAISKITQYSRDELIGRDLRIVSTAGNENLVESNVKRVLAGETLVYEIEILRKDGTTCILSISESAVNLPNGKIKILSIANDITERLRTEKALRESELRFKNVFDHHSAIMLLIEPESGMITDANDVAADFYGYSKSVLKSMNIDEINFLPKELVKIERGKASKNNLNYFLFQHRLANGEERTVEVHSSPINFPEKQFLFSIIHDITDRKRMEDALAESEEKYRSIFSAENDALFIIDKETGAILDVNDAACTLYQYSRDEMLKLKNTDMSAEVAETIKATNEFRSKIGLRFHKKKDSAIFPVDITASLFTLNNKPVILAAIRDITEQTQKDLILQGKNEELQKVNAEKDKFFSIIAHDLRGPIGGFMSLTERMAEGMAEMTLEELQNMARIMKKSSTNLYSLLANLLEWSRMQRGLTTFEPVSFRLLPRIHENLVLAFESAKKKEITIGIAVPIDLEAFADVNMLASIMRNIVTNALKFTPKRGKINIAADITSKGFIEISITDSGIGMDTTIVENLFNLDVNTNRKGTDGELSTGLGLTICKDFIEKHGGELKVESEPGKGSTFSFTIPANT